MEDALFQHSDVLLFIFEKRWEFGCFVSISFDVLFRSFENFIIRYAMPCYFHIQLSKYSVYYVSHRANVLLNILGVQMLLYSISYITKFISVKEDGYPKISLTTTLFKNSIIPLQIIHYKDTCLKFSLLKN